jgi:hypothetical protein
MVKGNGFRQRRNKKVNSGVIIDLRSQYSKFQGFLLDELLEALSPYIEKLTASIATELCFTIKETD